MKNGNTYIKFVSFTTCLLVSCQIPQQSLPGHPEKREQTFSASPISQPGPSSTVIPSIISSILPTVSTPSPSETSSVPSDAIEVKSEITGNVWYCPKQALPSKISLHYPSDIAVTPDGQTVYAINPICFNDWIYQDSWSRYVYGEWAPTAFPEACKQRKSSLVHPRTYLYKVTSKQKPEIMMYKGKPILSCQMGQDLEIDNQQNLYFVDYLNRQIIQYSKQGLTPLLHTYEESGASGGGVVYDPKFGYYHPTTYFEAPVNLKVTDSHLIYHAGASGSVFSDGYLGFYEFKTGQKTQINRGQQVGVIPHTIYNSKIVSVVFPILNPPNIGLAQFHFTSYKNNLVLPEISIHLPLKKSIYSFDMVSTPNRKIYLSDIKNHSIWSIELNNYETEGELKLLAGSGYKGYRDGKGNKASFYAPTSLSIDALGNIFVADTGNHAIRKITPEGVVTTFYKETEPSP